MYTINAHACRHFLAMFLTNLIQGKRSSRVTPVYPKLFCNSGTYDKNIAIYFTIGYRYIVIFRHLLFCKLFCDFILFLPRVCLLLPTSLFFAVNEYAISKGMLTTHFVRDDCFAYASLSLYASIGPFS